MPLKKVYKKLTNWEAWPFGILYAPMALVWLNYVIRSKAVWFFTPANPRISFGGIIGESKSEVNSLLPAGLLPSTIYIEPGTAIQHLLESISNGGFTYPFVVKPDIGEKGMMFRKICNEDALLQYHRHSFSRYLVQEFSAYSMEVSVFYTRLPTEEKGIISGFLLKTPMHVVGDGRSRLVDLIHRHPKGKYRLREIRLKHASNFEKIIPRGGKYQLAQTGNHSQGAQFTNLIDKIHPGFVDHFDMLSKDADDLFYGRYDIMCNNIEDLLQWKNFHILEFNGVGAEPHHFYDTGYSLRGAYKEISWHWQRLFEISLANRKRGIQPWPFKKGKAFLADSIAFMKKLKETDRSLPI